MSHGPAATVSRGQGCSVAPSLLRPRIVRNPPTLTGWVAQLCGRCGWVEGTVVAAAVGALRARFRGNPSFFRDAPNFQHHLTHSTEMVGCATCSLRL